MWQWRGKKNQTKNAPNRRRVALVCFFFLVSFQKKGTRPLAARLASVPATGLPPCWRACNNNVAITYIDDRRASIHGSSFGSGFGFVRRRRRIPPLPFAATTTCKSVKYSSTNQSLTTKYRKGHTGESPTCHAAPPSLRAAGPTTTDREQSVRSSSHKNTHMQSHGLIIHQPMQLSPDVFPRPLAYPFGPSNALPPNPS